VLLAADSSQKKDHYRSDRSFDMSRIMCPLTIALLIGAICLANADPAGRASNKYAGVWDAKWKTKRGSKAVYSINSKGNTMKVLSCSWRGCKKYTKRPITKSASKAFPASDGWLQVLNLHYKGPKIYLKKVGDRIKLVWRYVQKSELYMTRHKAKVPSNYAGLWDAKWKSGSRAEYLINPGDSTIKVKSCNWRKCKHHTKATIMPSPSSSYPSSDGWLLALNLHDGPVLYLKKVGDKIKLIWIRAYSKYKRTIILTKNKGAPKPPAPPAPPPQVSCTWVAYTSGDGQKKAVGSVASNPNQCAEKCYEQSLTDHRINGAMVRNSDKYCWCQLGMTKKVSNHHYTTCIFKVGDAAKQEEKLLKDVKATNDVVEKII